MAMDIAELRQKLHHYIENAEEKTGGNILNGKR